MVCPKTDFIFKVVLQALLVFCCLTLFYYNYVVTVEKEDVEAQLDIVVARLLGDKSRFSFLTSTPSRKVSLRGALESLKENEIMSLIDSTIDVHATNTKLQEIFKNGIWVNRKIEGIEVIRASWLDGFLNYSGFYASNRVVNSDSRLRGVWVKVKQ